VVGVAFTFMGHYWTSNLLNDDRTPGCTTHYGRFPSGMVCDLGRIESGDTNFVAISEFPHWIPSFVDKWHFLARGHSEQQNVREFLAVGYGFKSSFPC
jgi:hypothetical protein